MAHDSERDPAREFHTRYVAFCRDCNRAGIKEPNPEEWMNMLEAEAQHGSDDLSSE